MSFFSDAINKASADVLYTNANLPDELNECIMSERRVRKVEYRPPEEFCEVTYKPNIPKLKEINAKLIPKIMGMIKSGQNPLGQVIDGTEITKDLLLIKVEPKKLDNLPVNCNEDIYVAIDFTLTIGNIWDGIVSHFTREVNDFRKELGMTIEDRICLSWHFDFDRNCVFDKRFAGVDGNILFGKGLRDRKIYIKEEVLATTFLNQWIWIIFFIIMRDLTFAGMKMVGLGSGKCKNPKKSEKSV